MILILLASWYVFTSCENHEFASTKITYPYEPEQETIIDVDVVPVGDVVMELEDMDLEVNADYFNRYGIGVRLHLKDRMVYEEDKIYPMGKNGSITVYVVPQEYIQLDATAAYIIRTYSSRRVVSKIILGESFQNNRTLAHEIGHAYSLNHIKTKNNVMKVGVMAYQYDTPNDFIKKQIDTVMVNTEWYRPELKGEVTEIIID